MAQAQLQDGFGLRIAEAEARHERRLGLVLGANDADDLVDVQEGDQEAFEHVQPRLDAVQAVL